MLRLPGGPSAFQNMQFMQTDMSQTGRYGLGVFLWAIDHEHLTLIDEEIEMLLHLGFRILGMQREGPRDLGDAEVFMRTGIDPDGGLLPCEDFGKRD